MITTVATVLIAWN